MKILVKFFFIILVEIVGMGVIVGGDIMFGLRIRKGMFRIVG